MVPEAVRILLALAVLLTAAPAFPCSIVVVPHEIDPDEQRVDRTPPDRVVAEVKSIQRGKGPVSGGDGVVAISSCDDLGSIVIKVATADDRTGADKLGFVAIYWAGKPPEGLLDRLEVSRAASGEYALWWIDGATDEQELLEFAIVILAVDLAGNRSVPSAPLWVRHPGSKRPPQPDSCH